MFKELDDGLFVMKNTYTPNNNTLKIALFDMDYTILKPKEGRKYPKDENDWELVYNKKDNCDILNTIKRIKEDNYELIIITNQKGISLGKTKEKDIFNKIKKLNEYLFKIIQVKFLSAFILTKGNKYRKPYPNSFKKYIDENNFKIDFKESFMIGDGAGRKKDYSPSDFLFAVNSDLKFFLPEDIYNNNSLVNKIFGESKMSEFKYNYNDYCKINKMKKPEEYKNFAKIYFKDISYKPYKLEEVTKPSLKIDKKEKYIIFFCGSPGSGKSTFYFNYFKNLDFERINNDELKSISKSNKLFDEFISKNLNIVIDNTNFKKSHREYYVNKGKNNGYNMICLNFSIPKELAIFFDNYRNNNDFRKHISKRVGKIPIHSYYKNLEEFSYKEVDIISDIVFKSVIESEKEKEFFNLYLE